VGNLRNVGVCLRHLL